MKNDKLIRLSLLKAFKLRARKRFVFTSKKIKHVNAMNLPR